MHMVASVDWEAAATPDEVLAFKTAWGNRCPVVIVPTMTATKEARATTTRPAIR